ncbi:hypothetical protein [Streptomyces sp. NBC_01257]|uniref:hypothetical protein n=1 Tax=Streptomyces sp. NBC_01257 TaxID=2903799 RepID=UPI002DD7A943|nr:hypothetical protein [Streptomyces sp. NBC_01257]WRZ68620.1 hypothetical protein OG408_34150 [Streptomyces sp. NBC_01257]
MRHVPFIRWVLTLGVLLIGCSAAVYTTAPEMPELRQVDLTVLEEAPDGACTVRWKDPFDQRRHEAPYRCDTTRDPVLKAPNHDLRTGHGWDTGFVVAEGGARGELYSLSEDDEAAGRIGLSDTLTVIGLLLTITGLVGGNIRAVPRLRGVDPDVVRRAWDLAHAADLVAEDYEKALAAVRGPNGLGPAASGAGASWQPGWNSCSPRRPPPPAARECRKPARNNAAGRGPHWPSSATCWTRRTGTPSPKSSARPRPTCSADRTPSGTRCPPGWTSRPVPMRTTAC